jgi:hypothetical protein
MTPTADLAALQLNDFSSQLDTVFGMQAEGGEIALKLVKVEPAGQSRRIGGAFGLSFVAAAGPWQPQGTYPVAHPALGVMEIFLVPIGPLRGGNGYHATFT